MITYRPLIILTASLLFTIAGFAQAVLIADINQGDAHSLDFGPDKFMIEFEDKVYFSAISADEGLELWVYDGVDASLVKDINPGPEGSEADNFFIVNGKLIFMADDGVHGVELWETDGTEAGTKMIVDLKPGEDDGPINCCANEVTRSITVFKDELYFNGNIDGFGRRLFKTDGTAAGTVEVGELGSNQRSASSFIEFNDELFITVTFEGWWKTDGTTLELVKDEDHEGGDFEPLYTYDMGDYMIMVNEYDWDLWRSDGTAAGTTLIKDMVRPEAQSNQGTYFLNYNGVALFTGADGPDNAELWRSDGTEAGTYMVKDVEDDNAFIGIYPRQLTLFNDLAYYIGGKDATGNQMYFTDGTEAGTQELINLDDVIGGQVYFQSDLLATDNFLFFTAGKAFDRQLWYTDGTAAGTHEIVVNPNDEATPERYFLYKNQLIFFARGDGVGFEPYYVDVENLSSADDLDSEARINIYPNPSYSWLNIASVPYEKFSVELKDLNGARVLTSRQSEQIDVSCLDAGCYFVTVWDENTGERQTGKVIVGR